MAAILLIAGNKGVSPALGPNASLPEEKSSGIVFIRRNNCTTGYCFNTSLISSVFLNIAAANGQSGMIFIFFSRAIATIL